MNAVFFAIMLDKMDTITNAVFFAIVLGKMDTFRNISVDEQFRHTDGKLTLNLSR